MPRRRIAETVDDGFDAFFRTEHPRVLAAALALTGVREVAVDIAQESLTRALRDWERVSALDHPAAWVRRVAVNLVNDWHRSNARFTRYAPRLVTTAEVESPDPESARFWSAVRALPDLQRSAVALYYLEDRSVAEVADALDVPAGTVKSSLSRARASLALVLGVGHHDGATGDDARLGDETTSAPGAPVAGVPVIDDSEWAP